MSIESPSPFPARQETPRSTCRHPTSRKPGRQSRTCGLPEPTTRNAGTRHGNPAAPPRRGELERDGVGRRAEDDVAPWEMSCSVAEPHEILPPLARGRSSPYHSVDDTDALSCCLGVVRYPSDRSGAIIAHGDPPRLVSTQQQLLLILLDLDYQSNRPLRTPGLQIFHVLQGSVLLQQHQESVPVSDLQTGIVSSMGYSTGIPHRQQSHLLRTYYVALQRIADEPDLTWFQP